MVRVGELVSPTEVFPAPLCDGGRQAGGARAGFLRSRRVRSGHSLHPPRLFLDRGKHVDEREDNGRDASRDLLRSVNCCDSKLVRLLRFPLPAARIYPPSCFPFIDRFSSFWLVVSFKTI